MGPPADSASGRAAAREASSILVLKNVAFTLLVPGTVTVLVPYLILASSGELPPERAVVFRRIGLLPALFGACLYLWCVWSFATKGRGTPAPIDPPTRLVVAGPYVLTRNPMYVAVVSVLLGEAWLFASGRLLAYALAFLTLVHLFVVLYEEPHLHRRFGPSYEAYCAKVPRWLGRRSRVR